MFKTLFSQRFASLLKMDADGGTGGGGGAEGGTGSEGANDGKGGGDKGGSENKFSQEDLNRIGAAEKAAGKNAILKALGFEDEAKALEFVKAAKIAEDAQKTQSQKDQEAAQAANKTAEAEKARAELLEQKIKALSSGANAKMVDDLVILARNRVSDTVTFDQALETIKKEASFATFFKAGEEEGDTGGSGNPPRNKGKITDVKGLGKRLAETKQKSNGNAEKAFKGYFTD